MHACMHVYAHALVYDNAGVGGLVRARVHMRTRSLACTIDYVTLYYYIMLHYITFYYNIIYYLHTYIMIITLRYIYYIIVTVSDRRVLAGLRLLLPRGADDLRDKDLYTTTNKCLQCLINILYTVF